MSIVEFLRARLAEDKAGARAAAGAPWVVLEGVDASLVSVDPVAIRDNKWAFGQLGHVATTSHAGAYAAHIARHDPARVLAECEAKRRIVERFSWAAEKPDLYRNDMALMDQWQDAWDTLADAAAIHADHPDYREEWKP